MTGKGIVGKGEKADNQQSLLFSLCYLFSVIETRSQAYKANRFTSYSQNIGKAGV